MCSVRNRASQLGHNPGLWPLRFDKYYDFEEDKLFSPWELVHISQTSLVIWVLEYHLDPYELYDQWIIHAEQHNFVVILNPGELDRGEGHPSQY